jgi:hypothetical protein
LTSGQPRGILKIVKERELILMEMNWDAEIGGGTSKKLWGWRVIRDYGFNEGDDERYGITSRAGKTYRDYQGGKHRYMLRDDDGNACYLIESDIDPNEGYEEELFAPLDWAMRDVGATEIHYRDKDGVYKVL